MDSKIENLRKGQTLVPEVLSIVVIAIDSHEVVMDGFLFWRLNKFYPMSFLLGRTHKAAQLPRISAIAFPRREECCILSLSNRIQRPAEGPPDSRFRLSILQAEQILFSVFLAGQET
jgi:hypothetical protein